MENGKDIVAYTQALIELKSEPVQGPHGMYHVKNGVIHYGYNIIGTHGFSTSEHYWNIFH
jgi:hypothetical protein